MSITACVFVGLISGLFANRAVKGSGQGLLMDLIIAVIGAVAGGVLLRHFDQAGAVGFTSSNVLAAATGALVMLLVARAVGRFGRVV
jgi:uncharacterized membrane protein YeaQ/YmgE (transglycosylase-associated protein family)